MVANGSVPRQLQNLLESPRIWKVGRHIEGDIRRLSNACSSSRIQYAGVHDLAVMAKERCVYRNIKNVSLADLTARILHRRLNKNVAERTSNWWNNPMLTTAQVRYAALDVYASLQAYQALATLGAPKLISEAGPEDVEAGTPVMLQAVDKRSLVASGKLVEPGMERGQCRVEVIEVFNGASKIPHQQTSLSDYGASPFAITYPSSHVLVYTPLDEPPSRPHSLEIPVMSHHSPSPDPDTQAASTSNSALANAAPAVYPPGHEVDAASAAFGERMLGTRPVVQWSKVKRSRIIKDIFHAMHMFNIPRKHGLRREFARALRDAFYIFDAVDVARLMKWATSLDPNRTFLQLFEQNPRWVLRRCKRQIAPPEILYARVAAVIKTYGPLKDAKTGEPLFNEARWGIANSVLDLVERGLVSDPPGVALYSCMGRDKNNFPLYRCFRGTNMTEGGVHTHLRPHLPTSGASLEHVEATLTDFVVRHNLLVSTRTLILRDRTSLTDSQVGTKNTTGKPYRGHFSIWTINEIEDLKLALKDSLVGGYTGPENPGWINVNWYKRTSEVPVGVLQVPEKTRREFGLEDYLAPAPGTKAPRYDVLAEFQATRKAILPVHTPAEHSLYQSFMNRHSNGNHSTRAPNWTRMAKEWNAVANTRDGVYYKVCLCYTLSRSLN